MVREYPKEQIEGLKRHCERLSSFPEGGHEYFLMEGLLLPDGCSPERIDALLCPTDRGDGYPSRLFCAGPVSSTKTLNWTVNGTKINVSEARIGERNWWAFSWRVNLASPTLPEMLREHLSAFVRGQQG